MIEASAAVAAESSTGTWAEVWSNQLADIDGYKAKVYRTEDDIAYIACPMDLFEENSVVNIMSSIVGNGFGFKAVKLREAMELGGQGQVPSYGLRNGAHRTRARIAVTGPKLYRGGPMSRQPPIILGIVGDSAAGKTTITQGLVNILGADCVTHVCTDDYHKYDRKERAERGITPLHPDCNYIDVIELHLERLHYGQPILKPVYDHSTGTLVRPEYVQPTQFVIVEGLLGFSTPIMRQFFDVKVYLDPPEEMRKIWKIKRDTTKRGYTTDQVLAEMERREPDSRLHPAAEEVSRHPRAVLPARRRQPAAAGGNLDVQLVLRPTIPHPDLSYLDAEHPDSGIRLRLGRDDGRPVDFLEIDGDVASRHAEELEEAIWQHLPDLRPSATTSSAPTWIGARNGIARRSLTQLLIAYHLLRRYNDLSQLPFRPLNRRPQPTWVHADAAAIERNWGQRLAGSR